MAKFRDLSQSYRSEDRAVGDRQRHINFVREQIMSDPASLLEEIDIFKADDEAFGNVHKITLKMAKEYQFVFDRSREGNRRIGQRRNAKPGDILRSRDVSKDDGDSDKKGSKNKKAQGLLGGKEPGKLVIEVTPEEIFDILDEAARDLSLPYLNPRNLKFPVLRESRWRGLKETGIEVRLDLEASLIEKIRREQMMNRKLKGAGRVKRSRFIRDDLRYHGLGVKIYPQANVLVVLIMDISGSMDKKKRYYAKAFCYALYNFVRAEHKSAKIIFLAQETETKEVDSDTFFKLSSSGGTCISTGPKKALKIIKERFDPEYWDIYCVHCSDGENNNDDEERVLPAFKDLIAVSRLVGFLEIKPNGTEESPTSKMLGVLKSEKFKTLFVSKKEEVSEMFFKFLATEDAQYLGAI